MRRAPLYQRALGIRLTATGEPTDAERLARWVEQSAIVHVTELVPAARDKAVGASASEREQ